jgi:hypothetical protein
VQYGARQPDRPHTSHRLGSVLRRYAAAHGPDKPGKALIQAMPISFFEQLNYAMQVRDFKRDLSALQGTH